MTTLIRSCSCCVTHMHWCFSQVNSMCTSKYCGMHS